MMTTSFRRRAVQGFTLIELLIVVIIIAILAAIAIPQFSNTSGDAQESASIANLTTVRSAIELYRVQHNNTYPTAFGTGAAPACSGTANKGKAGEALLFTEQLTMFSDATGHTCTTADAGYSYGPYLRAIPNEPITNSAVVTVAATDADSVSDGNSVGWRFVAANGKVMIHSNKKARDGTTLLNAK